MTAPNPPAWRTPPAAPALDGRTVHVWRADLDVTRAELGGYRAVLAADELERASRFRFGPLRDRFVACRGVLRRLLSEYMGGDPARLRFTTSSYGKPSLDGPASDIRFNVANSAGAALIAVSLGREVGVDLEEVRPVENAAGLAARFFSPAEIAQLNALPAGQRDRAFITCWARKEAYVKAAGRGLSIPLDSFDVTAVPGEPARLAATRPDPAEAHRWEMHDLKCGEAFVGALVIEAGAPVRLEWFERRSQPG